MKAVVFVSLYLTPYIKYLFKRNRIVGTFQHDITSDDGVVSGLCHAKIITNTKGRGGARLQECSVYV